MVSLTKPFSIRRNGIALRHLMLHEDLLRAAEAQQVIASVAGMDRTNGWTEKPGARVPGSLRVIVTPKAVSLDNRPVCIRLAASSVAGPCPDRVCRLPLLIPN